MPAEKQSQRKIGVTLKSGALNPWPRDGKDYKDEYDSDAVNGFYDLTS
jgi:hypothetical protein